VPVPMIPGEGLALCAAAGGQGVGWVLARDRRSPYLAGVRSSLWKLIAVHPEAASAAAFVSDAQGRRWYKSGDLATFDPERGYTINGRLKELVISGGFNVYPIEVEDELLRIPGIRAAAVVGQPDPARGEIPVAFVETDAQFDAERTLATLRERLASFKVPKHLYPIDALPRNAMGKVEKPRLRELLQP